MSDRFVTDRAIVVGFGSIGARHAEILTELGLSVTVVSRREQVSYPRAAGLADAVTSQPDALVVIANETSAHHATLAELLESGHTGPVLVEKPLYRDSATDLSPGDRVFVGYNLRFHPLLAKLRDRLAGRSIHTIEAAVGQYLPDWRPQREYREGYSASRAGGGGVLRDLSHEIDYMLWLFGAWERLSALVGCSGSLDVESEDYAHLLIRGRGFQAATLGLDYLDRNVRRAVNVVHDGGTTRLDFVAGSLVENGSTLATVELDRNHTYRAQHEALLRDDRENLANYQDGLQAVRMLEAAERAASEGEWVTL